MKEISEKMLKRGVLVFLVLLFCVSCDQYTKGIASQHLMYSPVLSYGFDTLRLQYAENTGAFLSLGAELPGQARFWIFTVLATALLLAMCVYVFLSQQMTALMVVSISMMIGGGLSNLIDRIFNNGAVVDFINLGIGDIRTGIFNIADMVVLLGVVLLLISSRQIHGTDKAA